MPIYRLKNEKLWFPDPDEFEGDVVAVEGDLRPERLVAAYSQGIFPWYNDPGEIVWWHPEERCVLHLEKLRVSHSMRNTINRCEFTCTFDRAFEEVIEACREGEREGETWIHDEVVENYIQLHKIGLAHSVEVWKNGKLVGGLYGVSLGSMFCGESMFARESNASKFGFIFLVNQLKQLGWKWIDCQVINDHLESLGAEVISRDLFIAMLRVAMHSETIKGNWGQMDLLKYKISSDWPKFTFITGLDLGKK